MRSIGLFLLLAVISVAPSATASGNEPVANIRSAAVHFVQTHLKGSADHIKIHAAGPDKRLRLARCGQSLTAFLPSSGHIDTRTTVGVRCNGPKPWRIYVPVMVSRYGKVVIATHSLRRGEKPATGDIKLANRNLDQLPFGWLSRLSQVRGHHIVRNVRQGQVITPAMLAVNNVIERGQRVTLLATTAGISVRMSGQALADAAPDERVRVKNLSSQRIVEGVARSSHVVVVSP